MKPELSRRSFLKEAGKWVAGAATFGVIARSEGPLPIDMPWDEKPHPSAIELWKGPSTYKNLIQLNLVLRSMMDSVTPHTQPIATQQDVNQFTEDITPYFLSTGIVDDPTKLTVPKITITDYYKTASMDMYDGAIADSQCFTSGHVRMSSRDFAGVDKYNAWNGGQTLALTGEIGAAIAHEVIEAQAVHSDNSTVYCNWGSYYGVPDQDTFAQLASSAVMSAYYLDSLPNTPAVDGLAGALYQFKRFAKGELLYWAVKDKRWDALSDYASQLPNPDEQQVAVWELKESFKGAAKFDVDMFLHGIDIYNRQPFLWIKKSLATGQDQLPLLKYSGGAINLSETKYLVTHLEGLVGDYAK